MVTVIYTHTPLQASQDPSSSLPSSTVSCAIVYLYMMCEVWTAITLNNAHQHSDEHFTALSLFIYLPVFILAVGVVILVSCVKVILYLYVCLSVCMCCYLLMCIVYLLLSVPVCVNMYLLL